MVRMLWSRISTLSLRSLQSGFTLLYSLALRFTFF